MSTASSTTVSEMRHKRKGSLQDSPVDMSQMRMVSNCLDALKEELDGIKEMEGEAEKITVYVEALGEILKGSEKPVRSLALNHGL